MKITLIGLGMVCGDMTLRAKEALDGAAAVFVRTENCAGYQSLKGYNVTPLDYVFKKSRNFDTLNKNLAAEVLKAAKTQNVAYCVDGSVAEDEGCKIILARHKDCEVCDTVSKGAYAYTSAKLTNRMPVYLSAYSVGELKPCRAACIYDVDCAFVASEVKLKLSEMFGEESGCVFVRGNSATKIKIYEIDRQKEYSPECAVAVEEGEFLTKDRYDYADLEHIIKLLRAPGGCPWDRAQTPKGIKKDIIEEAYELADAVERDDTDGMEEETGDVLLQAAFISVMTEEQGLYTSSDAITRLVKKLIFRHSHIFGKDKAKTPEEALGVWEKNKVTEKGQSTYSQTLQAVPKNFPALMRAQKVGKRAAKCGFDFLSPISASEKLWEEVNELIDRLMEKDQTGAFEEAGDLLFAATNTVRLAGVDCEEALKAATDKFIKRFTECERLALADGKTLDSITGDGLLFDYYWEKAKNALKSD